MKRVSGFALAAAMLLFVGCGGEKPAKTQRDTQHQDIAQTPAAQQAQAATTAQAPQKGTVSAATGKTATAAAPAAPAMPITAGGKAADVKITAEVLPKWAAAMQDMQKLAEKLDKVEKDTPPAMLLTAMAANTAEMETIAKRQGFKDFEAFGALTQRIAVAAIYAGMKKGLEESMKDLPAEYKAIAAAQLGASIEQMKAQALEQGITQAELDILVNNFDKLQAIFGQDEDDEE